MGREDKILQGDKIEHPDFIEKSKLKVDYKFYLTNQIMNPTVQFLDIVMDNSTRMFDEAIKNEIYSKIGMKQNNLANYFKTKKVVYEDVNVYSEGKDDNAANDSESDKSFKICDD